jgi:hypothetical protein
MSGVYAMDEKTFNLSKSYNSLCRYWDFSKYRIYLSNLSRPLLNYSDYVALYTIIFTVYKLNIGTTPINATTTNFSILSKEEGDSLNIKVFNSSNDRGIFEKSFNILFALDKQTPLSITLDQVIAGPCSVCGTVDKWNSVTDNKSYCYLHCKY